MIATLYLIDSNAVSDYLSARLPETGMAFMHPIIDAVPVISIITQIEILGFHSAYSELFSDFVNYSIVYQLTDEVVERTISLRKSRRIKIPDAIIAATALVHCLKLITHNSSDFSGIAGLSLIDLYHL